jgi:hypothetical protein
MFPRFSHNMWPKNRGGVTYSVGQQGRRWQREAASGQSSVKEAVLFMYRVNYEEDGLWQ